MKPALGALHPSQCADVIALLDQEFILSRRRTVSLAERFSAALAQPDARMLVARSGDRVDAALLMRPFEWIARERSWRAAMIGLVWTRPELRSRGLGSALLREAAAMMRSGGIGFGVLWTSRPSFYAREGWIGADCGTLGRHASGAPPRRPDDAPPAQALWPQIHALRDAMGGERVARDLSCYRALLPPATAHDAVIASGAWALIGAAADTGYVFELAGHPGGIPALWERLRERYRELYINVRQACTAHAWLATQPGIAWQPQRLAMWLPLSDEIDVSRFASWYVPLMDRI